MQSSNLLVGIGAALVVGGIVLLAVQVLLNGSLSDAAQGRVVWNQRRTGSPSVDGTWSRRSSCSQEVKIFAYCQLVPERQDLDLHRGSGADSAGKIGG